MERKVKVDGRFLECEAEDFLANVSEALESHVLALTAMRLEFAAEEKRDFVCKFTKLSEALESEMEGMDEKQKSNYVFRHMLLKDGLSD